MIKITVNPQGEPKSYSFEQDLIAIGDGAPAVVDICFPSEGLHQNHIKIILKSDGYWLINQANDPFVSLNNQPFGKKQLQINDYIQIRDHVLKIEEINFGTQVSVKAEVTKESLSPVDVSSNYPDLEMLSQDENPEAWYPTDITSINSSFNENPANRSVKPQDQNLKPSIEEAYNLDEQKIEKRSIPPIKQDLKNGWKTRALKILVGSFLISIMILALILVEVYFRANGESEKQEIVAAESLADFTMALTYANVYHIAPQKQNWIDPSFIKNNLVDLLSTTSISCSAIDSQGQFISCPYLLRFYTNQDFTRFVLLAQPAPTLSQWLIPKDALVVDSKEMEIRKIADLKTLNRLLSAQNPLDGSSGEEVQNVIKNAPLLSLNKLAKATNKKEFSPPRALNYLRPGAQNRIYNAPRYYQFSSTFVKKVMSMANQPLDNHALSILKSELEVLSKFSDLVFYSSGGIQEALNSYQALKKLGLSYPFLTGYLLISHDGTILNSHVVLDTKKDLPETIFLAEADPEEIQPIKEPASEQDDLSLVLRKNAEKSQSTLGPILRDLYNYLNENLEKDNFYLSPLFYELLESYTKAQSELRILLTENLTQFKREHPSVSDFLINRLLREFSLVDLYHSYPSKPIKESTSIADTSSFPLQYHFIPSYSFLKEEKSLNLVDRWEAWMKLLTSLETMNFN